jgi:circadian clock protein KaiB
MPMSDDGLHDKYEEFERLLAEQKSARFVLRLYVCGLTANSLRAIDNIKTICEEKLQGRYELEVVDVSKQPSLAKGEQLIAAPTLVKALPLPLRRLIGNLSDKERVIVGLDLKPKTGDDPSMT